MTKVIAGLAEMRIHVKPAELAQLIPVDGMEPALVIMADVRAYFQGAYELLLPLCSLSGDDCVWTDDILQWPINAF